MFPVWPCSLSKWLVCRFHHSSFFRANLSYQRWLHVHNDRMATGYRFVALQKRRPGVAASLSRGFQAARSETTAASAQRQRRKNATTVTQAKKESAKARMTIVTTVGKDNAQQKTEQHRTTTVNHQVPSTVL